MQLLMLGQAKVDELIGEREVEATTLGSATRFIVRSSKAFVARRRRLRISKPQWRSGAGAIKGWLSG
jgi:hypothetical protein